MSIGDKVHWKKLTIHDWEYMTDVIFHEDGENARMYAVDNAFYLNALRQIATSNKAYHVSAEGVFESEYVKNLAEAIDWTGFDDYVEFKLVDARDVVSMRPLEIEAKLYRCSFVLNVYEQTFFIATLSVKGRGFGEFENDFSINNGSELLDKVVSKFSLELTKQATKNIRV